MCRKTRFGGEIRMPESKTWVPEGYWKVIVGVHTVPEIYQWIDRKSAGK